MKLSRNLLNITVITLVALSSSVFFLRETASAQSLPLNETVIEKKTEIVETKFVNLSENNETIENLKEKKQILSEQLDTIKQEVQSLQQQLEEKKAKAAAEKKRLEALRNMFVNVKQYASSSSGNLYTAGNCTWYAKSRRPDLPNSLGNANTWYSRAAAQGFSVGEAPKKGAIATTTAGRLGHVAYVEGVSLDGQFVTISEMNHKGLGIVSSRTVHYTTFKYIYEL